MSATRTPLAQREHFVYRCYDADGVLLYVGATSDLPRRIRVHGYRRQCTQHLPTGSLGERMAFWVAERHPNRVSAFIAERKVIETELPLLNTRNKEHVA